MPFGYVHKRKVDDKWRIPVPHDLLIDEPTEEGALYYFHYVSHKRQLRLLSARTRQQVASLMTGTDPLNPSEEASRFYRNACPKKLDKSGRLTIPENMRRVSGLAPGLEATIVGQELWAEIYPSDRVPPHLIDTEEDGGGPSGDEAKAAGLRQG